MKRLLIILKDKRTQYVIIVWILLLKTIEIAASLLSEVEFLRFFAVLGFESLSPTANLVWNGLVIFTVLWLLYRLLKDVFNLSIVWQPLSRKGLFSLAILLIWTISAAITALQFTVLATAPLASPKLEVSRYYTPFHVESEDSSALVMLDDVEGDKVTLDLSRSVFTDPLSIYESGEISEGGTKYVGASYFTVKNSSLEQRMIEMRFCGNGSDNLQGWFANRVLLQNPLPINENATLMLLLKLTASSDGTAWTYIKIDFLSKGNKTYSLTWKFHDVPMNYVFSSHNGTRNNYLIGSITDWRFYQFDLDNLFYASFSRNPNCITCIEYGVGAEADNDITAQFLVAKISPQPLEVNEVRVENVKPSIKLKDNYSIMVRGLHTTKLFVILTPNSTEKNINTRWSLIKISRSESYRWNTSSFSNMTEMKISFNVLSNSTKLLLNGKKITPKPQNQQPAAYEINTKESEVTLIVVNETSIHLMPVVVMAPVSIFLFYLIINKVLSR